MVNALRKIPQLREIAVHLQSNEVLLHAPVDVDLGAAFDAIQEAGYTPDRKVWLSAYGTWSDDGFVPEGWSKPLAVPAESRSTTSGPWTLLFEKTELGWTPVEVKPIETVKQVVDIDS